jgi:hypothetical protein
MSDRAEMEQFAHDHVEHWAQVANEAEARAERAEALVHQLGEALIALTGDRSTADRVRTTEQQAFAALAAYHQFLGEGSGE